MLSLPLLLQTCLFWSVSGLNRNDLLFVEKDTLFTTLYKYGYDWVIGVNLGDEDAQLDVYEHEPA